MLFFFSFHFDISAAISLFFIITFFHAFHYFRHFFDDASFRLFFLFSFRFR